MKITILLIMIFLHIVDDYYLQGPLAKFKQKSWWEENYPDEMYKHDYFIALLTHAFSWTFVIMIPIIVKMIMYGDYSYEKRYLFCFLLNWVVHATIDHIKANKKVISLTTDQIAHVIQIIFTWAFFFV